MNQFLRKIMHALGLSLFATVAMAQGVTTSSMNGKVTDANGEVLPGATVIAVHTPSGTRYGNVTDLQGFFRIPNMRVGGPYKVTITFVGFASYEKNDLYLSLGQKYYLEAEMRESSTELEEIVVTASNDVFDGNRTGAVTELSVEEINAAPTVGRSIGDFARFNPQTIINEGNDGLEISIGGMNNRLNAIYIDGAVNNDVFGLAASGTNGGQTGVSPISLDAIEQFTVSVAPFDVRQSGFAGGSINAVTRSGTNDIEGSAYYFFRNQDLAGKTPFEDDLEDQTDRERLADFTAETYGFRVGGPIVKDKVFFFVNAELQRDETPQPFDFNNYRGSLTQADINELVNFLDTRYNYNPGSYLDNTAFLESDKVIAKFDVNLNQNNKLTLRHSYTKAENLEARQSSATGLRFINGSEFFTSETNSSALELRTMIGNNMSNHLTVGVTTVRDDRDPFGDPFPAVFIDDGQGGITFGSETFSTANLLDQDIITITNNLELYKGKHTILIGANAEFYSTTNLFIPNNFGNYSYSRQGDFDAVGDNFLDDFLNERPASQFSYSYGLNSSVNGDETTGAAAEFNSSLFGLYVQDEIQASDKLKLTVGLRADINFFEDTPENPFFNNPATLDQFPYNLQGARTGEFIDPQVYFSPRFGFNYDVTGDRTFQLRGGVGIFTSRIPLVWPGAAYNNNGLNLGSEFRRVDLGFLGPVPTFEPNVNNQLRTIAEGQQIPSGNVDLFVEDFRIPQVLKLNLAGDKALPGDMVLTVEGVYTKFLNNVYYQNINVNRPQDRATGTPDDRLVNYEDRIDGTYQRIMLGSNTSKGYTYNLSASLTKDFGFGLQGQVSYSYGDAWTIYDGTSSQNSSQWRGLHAVNGRNNWTDLQRSDFAQGHRILANLTYKKSYGDFASTQVSLVYEGQSGNPFTYVYGEGDDITQEDSRNRELVYVPRNASEIVLVDLFDRDGNLVATPEQQWEALDAFIEDDSYLSDRRGKYTERNQSRTPFESIVDLRILQDFYLEMGNGKRNTLQLSLDIFNVGNLISSSWGKRYGRQFSGYELLQFEGFAEGSNTPTYTFQAFDEDRAFSGDNEAFFGDLDDSGVLSSRWQMQLGVRYIFGN